MPSLGAQIMREHLFVFDIENRRVRWKPSSECEL
ncbi:hypothetical protein M758_9G021000 [Ceratodon purpureus]|uniref:Uncharacterized protein n=1 Tax=Ceratodon purpureus TaxID=3225 RepID=A0A8T0GMV0_CERPU|nr:hypothetical protein KC19_9G020900 [Ceratodon purpureus]KAG0604945.1 hypothetical protein M758_9G021000 [Ceratodon purpureus]